LNGKQARQSLFLSQRTNRYTEKDSDNLNKVLLPNETIVETVDGKLCRSIGNKDRREIWAQNVFDMPIAGMLLSLNHRTTRQRRNNLLFYITAFGLSIHPELLLVDLSRPLNSGLVVEDHGSIVGVTTLEIYTDGTTTILLSTLNKQYESSDKSISNHKTHSAVLHKSAFELTTNTTYLPWKKGTTQRILSEIWKLFLATLGHNSKGETNTETRKIFLMSSNSISPTTHHHKMFLRKTKSTPILKTSSTFEDENERLNRNINHLQNMIDDMILEYQYMEQPLKFPRKQETSTTDNSIFLNQRND
jgi:hypothetical protein